MKYSLSHSLFDEKGLEKKNCVDDDYKFKNGQYSGIGIRHLQSLLLTLSVLCAYLQRVNLSITIVAITNIKKTENYTSEHDVSTDDIPLYAWSNDVRSYILSAFFVGYLIMNFPAAVLGVHFSKKKILAITFFANGILSCLTPWVIQLRYNGSNTLLRLWNDAAGLGNWRALIVLRVIQGMLQAFMFPTIQAIIARWAPPHERSWLAGFIMSGIPFGTALTLAGSGLFAGSFGWPSVFYVSGSAGILWCILWTILGADSPSESRLLSAAERSYICSYIPADCPSTKREVPWKSLLTSWPVWAIAVSHTGHNWGFWLLLQEMPTFIHEVLGFDIKSDGLFAAVPYLCMWLFQLPVMSISDYLIKHGFFSITTSRKLWNTIGLWGGAISLIILGYMDEDATPALILYVTVVTISCCGNVGFNINHVDLSPNYAGIIMGISNDFGATGGFGAPLIVAYIINDMTSVEQWRVVFYIGAAIMFFSNLFFIIFGSGRTQPWNDKFSDTSL